MANSEYLLAGGSAELERLQLQARVWEPDAEKWLDQIGIQVGWRCLDMGCGAMGILGPLSRRVGESGSVVGIDSDKHQLQAAGNYVASERLSNVEIIDDNAYVTRLPSESFDLVHARFLFAPAGHDESLLAEMNRLIKPGGIIAIQEPDSAPWTCYPKNSAWDHLKAVILEAFKAGGGDFDVGRRTYQMVSRLGYEGVTINANIRALQERHPYMRVPVQFATSLRARIIGQKLMTEAILDAAIADCEQHLSRSDTTVLTFAVVQVWGRKPT